MIDIADRAMGSYPGGKSGAGIFQRLINLIPPHRVLIVPFAGHCGVVRNMRPAEHTIVIDADPTVCEWWAAWSRTKAGRALEIHNCDGIEWLRFTTGTTKYSQLRKVAQSCADAFIFCDPPYVISERATGRIYDHELDDADHQRFVGTVTQINASEYSVMICGYACDLYGPLEVGPPPRKKERCPECSDDGYVTEQDYWDGAMCPVCRFYEPKPSNWCSSDHRVPTRGGLQDERIWMNYEKPVKLHDYQYIGDGRRSRERIRRRQKNWREQLMAMSEQERLAMLEVLNNAHT